MPKGGMIIEMLLSSAELLLEPNLTELLSTSLLWIAAVEAATGTAPSVIHCGAALLVTRNTQAAGTKRTLHVSLPSLKFPPPRSQNLDHEISSPSHQQ